MTVVDDALATAGAMLEERLGDGVFAATSHWRR